MAMTAESLRGPLFFPIDLKNGLTQQPIRAQLMKGDKRANTIIVQLTEDKKPADLTGATVTGSFISPMDGAEIPLEGSVNGNEASVTLIDECYAEDGYFEANVKLTVGETSRTVLSITGYVLSKGSGAVIDVGDVIPSIDDIIAQYQTMKDVTESAQEAADAANEAAARAPYIDASNNHWMAWDANAGAYADTGVTATGPKGDPGTDGDDGVDGQTPYIGENGNWWIGNTDTGTKAQGPAGTGSGTVTSVKIGEETYKPDETGVVTLPETEGGAVQTVNGVSPDDTGNVNLVVDTIETNATRIAVTDLPNYPGVDIVGTDSDGTQTYQGSVRLNMQNTKGGYPVMEQVNPAGTATCEIYTTANKPSASDLGISFDSLTVNGVTPDEDGNVQLDAEDVGALSAGDVLSYEEIQASTDLTGKLPSAQALADGVGKIGKVLWSGSFTTGTITVPGLSEYETIAVKAGSVFMFGGKNYGHGGILAYGNKNPLAYAYRFTIDGDNVSAGVNQYDLGCYTADGAQQTVTQIYGIF